MDEKEILKEQVNNIEESITLFSHENKSYREAWIVNEFLKNTDIDFQSTELHPYKNDPPDIIFRNACFEVKEIQDEGRKRHKEYKEKLKQTKQATALKDLLTSYTPTRINMQEIANIVRDNLNKLLYAPDFCQKTDLLFYLNLLSCGISQEDNFTINPKDNWSKWRTVSVVANNGVSCVLWAASNAPEFLKNLKSKVVRGQNYSP